MSKIDELLKNEKVEWKKLGEVCEFVSGYAFKSSLFKETGNSIIRITNIIDGKVLFNNLKYFDESDYVNLDKYKIFPKDILIAMSGATTGKIGYNYSSNISYLNQRVGKFIPNCSIINNRYLFHFLFSKEVDFYNMSSGTGSQPNLSKLDIENLEIPIPTLKTQEKISRILDKFTNYVTELQTELQDRIKQYDYYRDKLLSEDYLNKLSEKFDNIESNNKIKWVEFSEVAKIMRGASPRPINDYITDSEDGIPWIKIGDVEKNSKYITETKQKITKSGAKKSRLLKKGDFILSNSMSYGRPFILKIDGAIHDGWASISDYEEYLDSDFLYHYLISSKVQNYWLSKMNSSSVNNLNSEIIGSLSIPIISKKLQKKVSEILDKFQSLLSDTSGMLPKEIEQRQKQYEYYREKLLTFGVVCANTHTHTHTQVISNSYFKLLKEAACVVGVSLIEKVKWKKLGEIGVFYGGMTGKSKSDFDNGNSKYITYKNVYSNISTNLNIEDKVIIKNNENQRKLMYGDILFTASSETPDECGMSSVITEKLKEDIYLNSFCFFLRLNDSSLLLPDYSKYLFRSYNVRKKITKTSGGVTRFNVSKDLMKKIEIPIPSLPVQEYVVSKLDKFDSIVNSITEGLPKEIELRQKQYEYYREKLLSFPKTEV